jgi:hypothetical protein
MSEVCPKCNFVGHFAESQGDNGHEIDSRDCLRRQLAQAKAELQTIEHNVAKVYCHITNDLISKANTDADVVIAHADDVTHEVISDAVKATFDLLNKK